MALRRSWLGFAVSTCLCGLTLLLASSVSIVAADPPIEDFDYTDLLPSFVLDVAFDTHPVWRLSAGTPRPARFPLMHEHGCTLGVMLPCPFDGSVVIGEKKVSWLKYPVRASSTFALLEEAESLNQLLKMPDPFVFDPNDPWQRVHESFDQLRTICRLSLEHQLPIVLGL